MSKPVDEPKKDATGIWLTAAGLLVAAAGLPVYVAQVSMQRLMMPWYVPAFGLAGIAIIGAAFRKRRTVLRGLALAFAAALTFLEVGFLYHTRLPAYAGPVEVGRPFPTFEAKRADGSPFTQADLAAGRDHVLVFFRGRW
jgi:hypothetical protein